MPNTDDTKPESEIVCPHGVHGVGNCPKCALPDPSGNAPA